jgi:hypothetical protein
VIPESTKRLGGGRLRMPARVQWTGYSKNCKGVLEESAAAMTVMKGGHTVERVPSAALIASRINRRSVPFAASPSTPAACEFRVRNRVAADHKMYAGLTP